MVLYDASDYRRAEEALDTALGLCRTGEDARTELACVTCLVYVLRERGEWSRAGELGRELIDSGTAVWVAEGLVGAIHAFQGKLSSARRMLSASRSVSSSVGHYNMFMDATTGLAYVAAAEGAEEEAAEHCRDPARPLGGERGPPLRGLGDPLGDGLLRPPGRSRRACTPAPRRWRRWPPRPATATRWRRWRRRSARWPCSTATRPRPPSTSRGRSSCTARSPSPSSGRRSSCGPGSCWRPPGSASRRWSGLCDAYRTASKLGARPLASAAAREVAALGESVAQRLGGRAATKADGVQLTRRELEVLRLVSIGRTNREIAQELFISQRTVDMHVRNLLGKLDCRSRVEASHRAGELGLLE